MNKSSLFLLLALAAASLPAGATAIDSGKWYHFQSDANNVVTNSSASGTTYFDPGLPAWTFSLIGVGTFDITDAQFSGDSFRILNNGSQIGFTGQGNPFDGVTNCGLDPTLCFDNNLRSGPGGVNPANGIAHTSLSLGTVGQTTLYSITLQAVDNTFFNAEGFFRVTGTLSTGGGTNPPPPPPPDTSGVPEPSTYVLMGSAGAALAWLKRRKV